MCRVAVMVMLLMLSLTAYAHPGGTDGSGGHTDRSTGEYHYHHGYSAHQHENGECPYDFDDKTGESSGSLGALSRYSQQLSSAKPTVKPTLKPTTKPKATIKAKPHATSAPQEQEYTIKSWKVVCLYLVGGLIGIRVLVSILDRRRP